MGTKTRKLRERSAREDEILDAAATLFSRHGYRGTTISGVARHAELAVGTIYNFFENKRELFNKLMVRELVTIHNRLRRAMTLHGSPIDNIRSYLRTCMELLAGRLDLARLYLETAQETKFGLAAGLDEEGKQLDRHFMSEVEDVIREGIRRGQFKDLPPGDIGMILDSTIHAVVYRVVTDGDGKKLAGYADSCMEILMNGIAADPPSKTREPKHRPRRPGKKKTVGKNK